MEITSIVQTIITAIVLIGTNLLICITADTGNFPKLTPSHTGFLTKYKISTDDDSNVLPLPWETFSEEISDLLSPEIFSQPDPISYLLPKVKKLPNDIRRRISLKTQLLLRFKDFPRRYTPYAEILSSLTVAVSQLGNMKTIIPLLQQEPNAESNYLQKPLDTSIIEPELSPLFSSYVFSDKNPPFRLLGKLLSIPEKDISNVKTQLENFMMDRKFPRRYSRYSKCLLLFFDQNILQRLKTSMAKIQPSLIANPSAKVTSSNYIWEDEDDESNSVTSDNVSSPKTGQARRPPGFRRDVAEFLSEDMFSQTNPLTYFLDKATKLDRNAIKSIYYYLSYHLDEEEFPQQYIPYAELGSSLLACLIGLENVNGDILRIRANIERTGHQITTDISTLDPDLSILFSPKIISNAPKPSVKVLEILITLPENEMSEVVIRLKELGEDYRFPHLYGNYNAHIWKFLDNKTQSLLRLQDDIREAERVLNSSTSTDEKVPVPKLRVT